MYFPNGALIEEEGIITYSGDFFQIINFLIYRKETFDISLFYYDNQKICSLKLNKLDWIEEINHNKRKLAQENLNKRIKTNLFQAILLPGMIDCHVHLPQFSAIGTAKGELLDWLNNYIFKLESKFSDEEFAKKQSEMFFDSIIKEATTTALVYGSSFVNACDISFEVAKEKGIRLYMGNTLMDRNVPEQLISSKDVILNNTNYLIDKWHKNENSRLNYALTPRFAASCSSELMLEISKLAHKKSLIIQTHLSENKKEIEYVKSLFPESKSYTEIYEKHQLLSNKTIFAHGIYLDEKELDTLQNHFCSIAHCPCSNRYLKSGILPTYKYLASDTKIGLGTDIAGGYNSSIIDESREAIENSKYRMLFDQNQSNNLEYENQELNSLNAFFLATLSGANVLGIADKIGSLESGKEADFVILYQDNLIEYNNETGISNQSVQFENEEETNEVENILNQIIYKKQNRKILQTYVQGNKIYDFNS